MTRGYPDRRQVLLAGGATLAALAGCIDTGPDVDPDAPPEEQISQHLDGANGDSDIVDRTDEADIRIENGDGDDGDGYAFHPAAVRIDAGATVTWEWVDGSAHSVTHDNGDEFDSGTLSGAGTTWDRTFEEAGLYLYVCQPHERNQRGALLVE